MVVDRTRFLQHKLITFVTKKFNFLQNTLRHSAGMPSLPGILLFFINFNASLTSSTLSRFIFDSFGDTSFKENSWRLLEFEHLLKRFLKKSLILCKISFCCVIIEPFLSSVLYFSQGNSYLPFYKRT